MTRRVLMIGPSLSVQGGIASVERLILAHPPPGWELRHVGHFVDGLPSARVAAFTRGLASACPEVRGVAAMHVHMAQRSDVARAVAFLRMASRRGVPTLLHAHASQFDFFAALPGPLRRLLAAELRRANLLATLSASWKAFYRDALAFPEDRIVVLPNPVEIPPPPGAGTSAGAEAGADAGRDVVTVVFLGRIGARKGAFDLLTAAALLPDATRARLRLVLAGDGEVERARRESDAPRLRGVVEILGWIGPEARDELLARSDVFALPSRNEGLPMSLLEGMAHGLAPIATPVGGVPEVVEDGVHALLVQPGRPDELAAALARLVDDASLRRRLGRRARERAEAFSTRAYAERLGDVYARLSPPDRHA